MHDSTSRAALNSDAPTSFIIIGRGSLQTKMLAKLLEKELNGHSLVIQLGNLVIPAACDQAVALIDFESSPLADIENHVDELHHRVSAMAVFNADAEISVGWLLRWPKMRGLFYRDATEEQFVKGVQALRNAEHWLPRRMLSEYLEQTRGVHSRPVPLASPLTRKEIEILLAMVSGASNADIAKILHLSQHTVKTHLYNLYRKIEVGNRVQAVSWAMANLAARNK